MEVSNPAEGAWTWLKDALLPTQHFRVNTLPLGQG